MSGNSVLFTPFRIKSLELKNRIVMAPMTRCFAPDGVPGAQNAAYYARRTAGGVGLILSEGTVIDRPASRNHPAVPFFHGAAALAGWKEVITTVRQAGGKMGPQLWHTGSTVDSSTDWVPASAVESPSGLLAPGARRGKPMSENAITDTIDAFARGAVEAQRLGFDTLEIHGAHGYLIDQFFWSGTNRRSDRYGGSTVRHRARFAAEVTAAIREGVGSDFPIIMRISQWKQQDLSARLARTPAEIEDWLRPLVDAGVDMLHCSQRRFWEAEFPEIDGENGLNFAGWVKKLTGLPTISVGSVGLSGDLIGAFGGEESHPTDLGRLVDRMERGEFDLIAVGRALIANPDWAANVQDCNTVDNKGFHRSLLAELI